MLPDLDEESLEDLRLELDEIYESTIADLGEADERYIRRLVKVQRALALGSRVAMMSSLAFKRRNKTSSRSEKVAAYTLRGAGMVGLGVAKILENMEIGHNVMHGQWDWMADPEINSTVWEWDNVCPSDQWKHGHNVVHHTWTNVIGKDRDVGYEIMRVSGEQPWHPAYLLQPAYNVLLGWLFEWGVGVHEFDPEKLIAGTDEEKTAQVEMLKSFSRKAGRQVAKDYVLWPALAGPNFMAVLVPNVGANLIRNLWSYMIIFCGHFPADVQVFDEADVEDESRGQWYVRQVLGSANIRGGKALHLLSGNLSHQIEHHLYPDMPSNRLGRVSSRVKGACERYGVPYNEGSLTRQFGTTTLKIWRYAFPGGRRTPS